MDERGASRGGELGQAFGRTGLTVRELWLRYLALGGNADEVWVDAVLDGLLDLPPGEYNVLAHAVNEALGDLPGAAGLPRVALRPVQDARLHWRR